jgi:hypothetical protein
MRPAAPHPADFAGTPAPGDAAPVWRAALACAVGIAALYLIYRAYVDGSFAGGISGWRSGERSRMYRLFFGSLVAAVAVVLARPKLAHRVLSLALLLWIVVAFGPTAVASVAAIAAASATLGRRMLRAIAPTAADPLTAVTAGAVAIAAFVGATAALRWHWPAAYGVALATVFVLLRTDLAALSRAFRRWWAPRTAPLKIESLLPWTLLGAVVTVHVAVAARPEVGVDALAMHLQVAMEMARDHRFRFDATRHVWAVMPLGADWIYAVAFQFAGEAGAKLANLAALLLLLAWIVRFGSPDGGTLAPAAIVAAALFASMPLAFAETGSLFIENYWAALLLGATFAGERAVRERSHGWALAAFWLSAGAMQAKVIALLWVAPLLLAVIVALRGRLRALGGRELAAIGLAAVVLAWPYANAWWRTGNPVFPFMNTLFRSPLFDIDAAFNNARYNSPLTWRSGYDVVVHSGRFLEGSGGAAGLHWLVLFPAVFVLVRRDQLRAVVAPLALAACFFVATWQQQSYLRYLYPAFALLAAVGARIVAPGHRAGGVLALSGATLLAAANLALMPAGGWWNATFCLRCGFDPGARARYIATYADQRPVVDWLNANAPGTVVGWLRTEFVGPAGLVSPHWRASWHDYPAWRELREMATPEDLAEFARRRSTMLFLLPQAGADASPMDRVISEFRDRYTTPVLVSGNTQLARWADTADRRLVELPAGLEQLRHNAGVDRTGPRVVFAPRGLAWLELPDPAPTLLSYTVNADCAAGSGRGIVEAAWLDSRGSVQYADSRLVACREDGVGTSGSFFAPRGARGLRVYVGSAGEASFALSAFTVSQR